MVCRETIYKKFLKEIIFVGTVDTITATLFTLLIFIDLTQCYLASGTDFGIF